MTSREPETPTERIIAMYDAGCSLRQIGQDIGRTKQAVRDRLRRAGKTLRPRGRAKPTTPAPADYTIVAGR